MHFSLALHGLTGLAFVAGAQCKQLSPPKPWTSIEALTQKAYPPHHISIFCTWGIHPSALPLATLRHCMGSVSIFYNPSIWFHREFEISSICRYLSFNVLTSSLSSRSSCVIYPLMSMYVMHLSCRKSICVVILLLYTPVILITSFFIHGFLLV